MSASRFLLPVVAAGALISDAPARAEDGRVPVVVELFSSEGCSSCPPADALLRRLHRDQPVPNARIIALEEHVDYWNQLGWNDPFSSSQFRFRQNDYARFFGVDSVYTPQMIVGGAAGFVGVDENQAYQEISKAAGRPQATIKLRTTPNAKDPALVDLSVDVKNESATRVESEILLAVTEENLSSSVQRGENAGRTLRHAPVVRSFGVIGKLNPARANSVQLSPTLRFPSEWNRDALRAVVFMQERNSHKIDGANTIDLR
jgi:hypothetical protein